MPSAARRGGGAVILLSAALALAVPSPGVAGDRPIDRHAAGCDGWTRHIALVIDRMLATGTLAVTEAAELTENLEIFVARCRTSEARRSSTLLQRMHDYLVDEAGQP